ncbi:MAG TPA: tail fiber domain-containing protein [Thermoanaerobaculia bacterium]|nr:tail fiber domain-containing protein [Thermoanaerobaculia bacterium]
MRRGKIAGGLALVISTALSLTHPGAASELPPPEMAVLEVAPVRLDWLPPSGYERLALTVSGPGDLFIRRELAAGQAPFLSLFDSKGNRLPDGSYTWELRGTPKLDARTKAELSRAREAGEGELEEFDETAKLPGRPLVQSGHFFVRKGSFVAAPAETAAHPPKPPVQSITPKNLIETGSLVVQRNACIGDQCGINDANFSALKLKSTLPNLLFDDVDVPCEDPPCVSTAHDWALLINPSDVAQFSIKDVDGNLIPFSVAAGAGNNSLYVNSSGNVGLGTSTPAKDVHVIRGNTPTARLEQDGSAGFTAQTWDVAANEANFFVRDVTSGSTLPFRIRPGAPTSSIDVSSIGNVGIGTASPSTQLHIRGTDSGSRNKILVENAGSNNFRELLEIRNNGGAFLILKDTALPERWSFGTFGSSLIFENQANAGIEMTLTNTGNVTIAGTLTQGSDRDSKRDLVPVQPGEVLAKVASLPITTWNRKTDASSVRHMGPMAQDFAAIFGLGEDDKHIAILDMAGVSLASIQALYGMVTHLETAKDAEIAALRRENADLARRIAALEVLVAKAIGASQAGARIEAASAP